MCEKCKVEFNLMLTRIEEVIKAQWPETLRDGGGVWIWLDANHPEQRKKLASLTDRLNAAWQNGIAAEVKTISLEWGRLQLDIFKGYARHLREAT